MTIRMNLKFRKWLIVFASTVGLVLYFLTFYGEMATKAGITLTSITKLGIEARNFYELNHHLPNSVGEFNSDKSFACDGWGQPIVYTVTSSNTFLLESSGADGVGAKNCIAYSFDVSNQYEPAGCELHKPTMAHGMPKN